MRKRAQELVRPLECVKTAASFGVGTVAALTSLQECNETTCWFLLRVNLLNLRKNGKGIVFSSLFANRTWSFMMAIPLRPASDSFGFDAASSQDS